MKNYIFTLLELLIVIAIISILAAMLLPAIGKAKNLGIQVHCNNNLRQLGITVGSYTNDYGYSLTYRIPINSSIWYSLVTPYIYNKNSGYVFGSFYNNRRDKYACPAVTQEMAADTTKWGTTMGTIAVSNLTPNYYSQLKGPNLKYPSRLLLATDGFGISCSYTTITNSPGELRLWHNGGANILYYDLHTNLRKMGSFTAGQYTPFWTPNPSYENLKD